ncbi:hypothetical protein chiPu_0007854 [Chiloscyllium punctatum]|uniref:Uncharacterized protein n=1 Tax=Chiloscyllium punctatum TaxID=137246 RepID=A0A401SG59_CHIPU|nr:hypothetical protein [Chiloscyllium punctatum]
MSDHEEVERHSLLQHFDNILHRQPISLKSVLESSSACCYSEVLAHLNWSISTQLVATSCSLTHYDHG